MIVLLKLNSIDYILPIVINTFLTTYWIADFSEPSNSNLYISEQYIGLLDIGHLRHRKILTYV
jgi:hypothetical protein